MSPSRLRLGALSAVRVASWNLNAAIGARASGLGALLAAKGPVDVALLQELTPTGAWAFYEAAGLDWCFSVSPRRIRRSSSTGARR